MIVLPNMGLVKWDQINDSFSHEQLAANFQALDDHDHTAGKGTQIPYGGLAPLSVGPENLQDGVFTADKLASADNEVYRTIVTAQGLLASTAVSTKYYLSPNGKGVSGTGGAVTPSGHVYLKASDYAVAELETQLNLVVNIATNATAPAVTFTFGLYPVSSVAGGSGLLVPTLGTVVTDSTSVFTTPSASTQYISDTAGAVVTTASRDFDFPSDGYYVPGLIVSGSQAANSILGATMILRVHHV